MKKRGAKVLARVPWPNNSKLQLVITLESKHPSVETPLVTFPGNDGEEAVFNLQLGTRRDEVIRALLAKYQLPRYRLLDTVLDHVQAEENVAEFCSFLKQYQDPRRVSGGQIHFHIGSKSQRFLHAMSWEFVQGNRSAVARAAIGFVCR